MSEEFMKNENRSFFHAWIADSRDTKHPPNISKQVSFRKCSYIILFTSDQEDKTRTNMVLPGYFPNNARLIADKLTIQSRFSNTNTLTDFIRGSRATLFVGDRPISVLPASIMADQESVRIVPQEDGKPGGFEGRLILRRPIAIPPRQGFYFKIDFSPIIAEQLLQIERGKVNEYGEIRIDIHGLYSSYIKKSDLSPEELKEALECVKEHKKRLLKNDYNCRDLPYCLIDAERMDYMHKNLDRLIN